jgi:Tol biopolymer transport system component
MSEYPMDRFDARLVDLMTAYGDGAVTTYDAAAIAHGAVSHQAGPRLGLALHLKPQMRVLLLLGAAALLAIMAAIVAASRHPSPIGDSFASPTALAWSPDGSLLAFVVDVADRHGDAAADASGTGVSGAAVTMSRVSHRELWVVDGNGRDPRRLARFDSTATVAPPIWARDGRSILVGVEPSASGIGHSAILAIGLDGSAPRTLLDAGADGIGIRELSPAGDRLLYLRSDHAGTTLNVLDLASETSSRLTTSGTVCCSGSWSPDGRWVMYTDGVTGGTQGPDAATRVVAADGSSQHRLGPCCDVGWSADGPRAYFQSDGGPLYSAAEDGTDVHVAPYGDAPYGWAPSPDGSAFVAVTSRGIEIVRPGDAPTSLTTDRDDRDPTWSPEGAWIAFSGIRSGVAGLYVMPATGGDPRLVASNSFSVADPWRPGAGPPELTLIRDRAIVTVAPDGAGPRDLVGRTTMAGDPVAPPDGSALQVGIVLGPGGPDRDIYRVRVDDSLVLRIQNRSETPWVIFGGLTEKFSYCQLVSGPAGPDPCAVAPGATINVAPPGPGPGTAVEVRVAPAGADYQTGFPVIVDLVREP